MEMQAIYCTMIKSGKKTYFVDVKEKKSGERVVIILQSTREGEERKRTRIELDAETTKHILTALSEAAELVS